MGVVANDAGHTGAVHDAPLVNGDTIASVTVAPGAPCPHHPGMATKSTNLDEAVRRELAVKAEVDPRTIEKALRGEPVRGMAGRRARRALRDAGFVVPEPPPRRSHPAVTTEDRA